MELSEAFVRVVGRHILLIALLVAGGLVGAGMLHLGDRPQYRATVRLALGSGDPSSQAQSQIIADTARALATGPALVADALAKVPVRRDAVDTAQHHVAVASLGSSGVVAMSVTDPDAAVAVSLANSLGAGVVSAHRDMVDGRYAATLSSVQSNIAETSRSIASIDAHIKAVGPLFDVVTPVGGVPLSDRPWAEPNQLLRQRADLATALGSLNTERASIESNRALQAQGLIVAPAAAPAERVPGQLIPALALGGLLGLVLGLGLAAVLETLRPTVVGRAAIARHLGAPVLAELRGAETSEADVAEAAMHIQLAAVGADLQRVALLALSRQLDLRPLADSLGQSVSGLSVHILGRRSPAPYRQEGSTESSAIGIRPRYWQPAADGATGVVLVTPAVVRLTELNRVVEFLTISGWPLMGLILIHGRRGALHLPRAEMWSGARLRRNGSTPLDEEASTAAPKR